MYDYLNDKYGKICLYMASLCKTDVGFGAVLVNKNKEIIGYGRNRLATKEDRDLIPRVDYCIHAEQDAIAYALRTGQDVNNANVYVLGKCLSGKNKGKLTTRTEDVFVCKKCPHAFLKYNINVFIPHINGWHLLTAEQAMETGKRLAQKGYWKEFVTQD